MAVEAMLAVVQEQLKRAGFEDFTRIEQQCMHFDLNRFVIIYTTL